MNIKATKLSPAIEFENENRLLKIAGIFCMSEPEQFFEPLRTLLDTEKEGELYLEVRLQYSNNNSQKFFHDMFRNYVKNSNKLFVKWYADESDDDIIEAAEDFQLMVKCESFELILNKERQLTNG